MTNELRNLCKELRDFIVTHGDKLLIQHSNMDMIKRVDSTLSAKPVAQEKIAIHNAPIGTKAPAIMGGHWYRIKHGWKWNGPDGSGGTFPRPGGDWTGELITNMAQLDDERQSLNQPPIQSMKKERQESKPFAYFQRHPISGGWEEVIGSAAGQEGVVAAYREPQPPKEQDVNADFYHGVIAVLGVLNSHGYPAGSTLHDEIVNSVGKDDLYAVAEPEDFEWAGLDAAMEEQK